MDNMGHCKLLEWGPLYRLSCPLKQSTPSPFPWTRCKPYSEFLFSSLDSLSTQSQRAVAVSVSFNPSWSLDLSLHDDEETSKPAPPTPPKEGRYEVFIDNDIITRLYLSPFGKATVITSSSSVKSNELLEHTIGFTINYTTEDEHDPRELSKFPDIRLWFVRLDAMYPWLPVVLDWRAGEVARYAAMLVPHQMSMRMGVVFNPEALELFVVYSWLKEHNIPMARSKAKDIATMLGYGIGDDLFDLVDEQ